MLWTFQCSNIREGTFWYSLKSRPLNSQLFKMSSSLHKSHLHSLPDTHQTPGAQTVWKLHWTHVHPNLTLGLTHPVGNIVKDGTEGQRPSSSLLKNITLLNILFFKFYILKWLNVKKAVPKCCLCKRYAYKRWARKPTEEKTFTHLSKVHIKMENLSAKSSYINTESEYLRIGNTDKSLQFEHWPNKWIIRILLAFLLS